MKSRGGAGDIFQRETAYDEDRLSRSTGEPEPRPEPFKSFEAPLALIALPEPVLSGEPNLWKVIEQRRSKRVFDIARTLTLADLSALLWATQGVTARSGEGSRETLFRVAPSAGALYPVETYLNVRAVEGLRAGIYHFRPKAFDLEYLKDRDLSADLARAALGQSMILRAQITFIWSAVIGRSRSKYHQRAYRYVYIEAGHIGQNLSLAVQALGLGCCMIGAFFDNQVNAIIGADGMDETAIYLAPVGRMAGKG